MKKIIYCVAVALVLLADMAAGVKLHADEGSPAFFTEAYFTKPQSPDAWAMTRYGEASLDLFHGTIGLTVPVYTYQDKDFTIPVSLSYASSGFMPGSSVGVAGLGWSLNAGGVITREVRGLPDDESNDYSWKWLGEPSHAQQIIDNDWVHFEEQMYGVRSSVTVFGFGKAYNTQSANLSDIIEFVYSGSFGEEYMAVQLDTLSSSFHYFAIETQPDIFHFNFLGRSGSFILCPDGTVQVFDTNFPAGDLSVEFVWNWQAPRNSTFILRTNDGFRYDFNLREDTSSVNQGYSDSEITSTSAWKLTTVTAPSGRTAVFSYNSPHDRISHGVSINVDHRHTFDGNSHSRPWQDAEYMIEHPEISDTYTTVQERSLAGIAISGGTTVSFTYGGQYSEYALQSITVTNSANTAVRSCSLTQSGSGTHRFLKSISINGEGLHTFSYYCENAAYPEYNTRAVDNYGYYTNSSTWQNLTHTDNTLEQYAASVVSARSFDATYAIMGMLQTIAWPTGGSTAIAYEQNDYSAFMRPDNMLALDSNAAGLRVASLIHFDTNGTTILQKKEYTYETSSGRSSGVLLSKPEYYWKYSYDMSWTYSVDREGVRSACPLGFGLEGHIEYPRIVELVTDGGANSDGPIIIREFESTYGSSSYATSIERYAMQPDFDVETPDGWSFDLTPHTVHLPESMFLSGGIHSGECILEQTKTEQGVTTAKTTTVYGEYPSGSGNLFAAPMVYNGKMFYHEYVYLNGHIDSRTDYLYDLSGSVAMTKTENRTVDDGGHLSSVQTTDSKGNNLRTEIAYHSVCTGIPIRVSEKRGNNYIGGIKMTYTTCYNDDNDPYLLPSVAYRANSSSGISSESGLTYYELISFDQYDGNDNLCQMTDSTGKVTGIVWDAAGLYPVKVGENMTYSQTSSASASYAGHMLTTYTWTPLVGLSSMTDPSGRTTTYSYDSAGRLTGVTAPNGGLSAAYAYNTATDHVGYSSSGLYNGASLTLPQTRNWVLTQTFDSGGNAASEVAYMNALGYPEQDVAVRASGDLSMDLVVPHIQDYLFREVKSFLPYPVAVSAGHGAGAYVSGAISGQNSFFCTRFSVSGDACAYSTAMTEEAPGGRPVWSRQSGKDYYSAGKTAALSYGANTSSDAVLRLDVGGSSGYIYVNGTYGAGTLVKTGTTDEDGRVGVTFTDREGHVVLKRRLSSAGGVLSDTYYAYDVFGRLCWVVSPEGSALLQNGHTYYRYPSASDTDSKAVKGYSYIYHYSSDNRVVEKNMAGVKDVELTYDDNSGLIESFIDGNLASYSSQLVYEYDGLNRMTEEKLNSTAIRQYVFDAYPSGMPSSLSYSDVSGITTAGGNTLHQGGTAGLLTYECIAELDSDGATGRYAQKAHYYDILGNCIQTVTLYPDGAVLRESAKFDLRGNVTAFCSAHTFGGTTSIVVTTNTYDNRGRLTGSSSAINGTSVSSVGQSYDDLGILSGSTYGNGVSESKSYNIRGQLTGQQSVKSNTTLFSSTLRYADTFNNATTPSWTGNISSWSWFQEGQDERTYVFGYDGLDRLVSTAQYKNTSTENKYGEDMTYDRNGNITSIGRRNGATSTATTYYTYDGNKRSAWRYDSNGNVTSEAPEADYPITTEYNILNLPALIAEEDGYETAVCYLADGAKYTIIEDSSADGYLYCGPFRCSADDGRVLDVAVPGGRAYKTAGGWVMRYYTIDHLGSVRLVTDASGTVVEQFDYLPYGGKCNNSGLAVANQHKTEYLYGGKELPQLFGIEWYDSAARWQTKSGVFSSPDPLMEKYYSVSPYAYCAGNPANFYDMDGMDRRVTTKSNTIIISAKYYVDHGKFNGISTYDAFYKAAKFLNSITGLTYSKGGVHYNISFNIEVQYSYNKKNAAQKELGANFVVIDESQWYIDGVLGGANGGKEVMVHNKQLGNLGVILHEMLHSMGAAIEKGPNGEDPHEETGLMTKSVEQQTLEITQKTIYDIINKGHEFTRYKTHNNSTSVIH